eukprot:3256629-Amphidinium_carterae.1
MDRKACMMALCSGSPTSLVKWEMASLHRLQTFGLDASLQSSVLMLPKRGVQSLPCEHPCVV